MGSGAWPEREGEAEAGAGGGGEGRRAQPGRGPAAAAAAAAAEEGSGGRLCPRPPPTELQPHKSAPPGVGPKQSAQGERRGPRGEAPGRWGGGGGAGARSQPSAGNGPSRAGKGRGCEPQVGNPAKLALLLRGASRSLAPLGLGDPGAGKERIAPKRSPGSGGCCSGQARNRWRSPASRSGARDRLLSRRPSGTDGDCPGGRAAEAALETSHGSITPPLRSPPASRCLPPEGLQSAEPASPPPRLARRPLRPIYSLTRSRCPRQGGSRSLSTFSRLLESHQAPLPPTLRVPGGRPALASARLFPGRQPLPLPASGPPLRASQCSRSSPLFKVVAQPSPRFSVARDHRDRGNRDGKTSG
ncbi:spidroin-2-like [Sarcophilus harrisii]|uniref:spidroin-2-like n=1 Tax=Sarcophilus harrisii TaxID=9305 RepID=UPI001301B1AA|nr:spidroin-2-like [Sarcophilus harrisii]